MQETTRERPESSLPDIPKVSEDDIVSALKRVGVAESDIVLTHSSLKSFGYVIGGPMSVINAIKKVVTESGTVVFPTLVQKDFINAYKNWDINKSPSDVGLITETFRLLPDSVRSDQETHSVAAWGKRAVEITGEHSLYGPRMGVFGDYCFSYSSPWQKMYLYGARIIFMGINLHNNTFRHFVEYVLMEHYCQSIVDQKKKCLAMSEIARFYVPGIWPFHDTQKTQDELDRLKLISYAQCGHALFTSIKADAYVDNMIRLIEEKPESWLSEEFMEWLKRYVK